VCWWPALGRIGGRRERGSGLRLATSIGPVHLKRRPVGLIEGELFVLAHLAGCGLPVTLPIKTASGGSWQAWEGMALWSYRELPGSILALDAPNGSDPTRLLGGASARLGRALRTIEVADARRLGVPLRPNRRGCSGLPVQVIHRDFHAGNVLFSGGHVSGYLDFDHVEIGPRVLDLCYAATSLLALMLTGHSAPSWPARWRALVEGYVAIVDLSALELSRTAELMIANEEDFLTWFESRGDAANIALTLESMEFIDAHAETIVDLAAAAAGSRQ
jgi:Ser/Thr protein kinase RdoA (MazF antagonist)